MRTVSVFVQKISRHDTTGIFGQFKKGVTKSRQVSCIVNDRKLKQAIENKPKLPLAPLSGLQLLYSL
ncbi:unnamed protein product, partial [Caenorhabditis brenneri]